MKRRAVNLKNASGTSVDRKTALGNPFVICQWYGRHQVVYAHKLYLWHIVKHGKEPYEAIDYVLKKMRLRGPRHIVLSLAHYFRPPSRAKFMSALDNIRDKPCIGCWCKPLACHADNYVKYLNWLDAQK